MALFRGTFFSEKCGIIGITFEICAELWVPFWENIAKSLGGIFSINKMNDQLEIKL